MGAILSCATDSHNIYTINRNKKLLFLISSISDSILI